MVDVKLFQWKLGAVTELEGRAVALEKSLQDMFEANLDALLGVRFFGVRVPNYQPGTNGHAWY